MTNRMLIGVLVAALALIGAGCDSASSKLESPIVAATVVNEGAALHLTWEQVTGASSYEIKAGDSTYTTTSTSLDVTNPAATIEVWSVSGKSKSDSTVVRCSVVETTVEFFGDLSDTHVNGFGFDDKGEAVPCILKYPDYQQMDFYATSMGGGVYGLVNPGVVNLNRRGNAMKAAPGSYADAKIADPLGTYSDSSLAIAVGSTYYLRISPDTSGTWSTGDNYAKAEVVSINSDSARITLNCGYQKLGGLRWLGN